MCTHMLLSMYVFTYMLLHNILLCISMYLYVCTHMLLSMYVCTYMLFHNMLLHTHT
jgi:hypothetical protein